MRLLTAKSMIMTPEIIKLTEKIFLLVFESQYDITSTFLRFQEHYESPKFRGKIFGLEEFKKWYVQESPNGRETGEFTYYSDWNGFNIPSSVLEPFYEGKFHPLSKKEQMILDIFEKENDKFYIIGVHKEIEDFQEFLAHETAHGLFHTDENYKKRVLSVLKEHDFSEVREELASMGGYHPAVLDDECHAYAVDGKNSLEAKIPKEAQKKLQDVFNKFLEKNKKI